AAGTLTFQIDDRLHTVPVGARIDGLETGEMRDSICGMGSIYTTAGRRAACGASSPRATASPPRSPSAPSSAWTGAPTTPAPPADRAPIARRALVGADRRSACDAAAAAAVETSRRMIITDTP